MKRSLSLESDSSPPSIDTSPSHLLDPPATSQGNPRKRNKTSRACDSCRSKKIRCDIADSPFAQQCSQCKRSGSECLFFRVPQKRGPVKGALKSTGERIGTRYEFILGKHHGGTSPDQDHPPSNLLPEEAVSSEETDYFNSRKIEEPRILLEPPTPSVTLPNQHPYTLSERARRYSMDPTPGTFESARLKPSPTPSANPYASPAARPRFEWDDNALDRYYYSIHPTYPILPHSKGQLAEILWAASEAGRQALLQCIYLLVSRQQAPSPDAPNWSQQYTGIIQSLAVAVTRQTTYTEKLVHLLTLILLVIEADHRGPATIDGKCGLPAAHWLGAAVGFAFTLRAHVRHDPTPSTPSTIVRSSVNGCHSEYARPFEDEGRIGHRAWLVCVILDRWQAISTRCPSLIPDSSVNISPDDVSQLGLIPYHLARLSFILGHISEALMLPPTENKANLQTPILGKLLSGELERFRETVEVVWGHSNLLSVTYWHVKLLLDLTTLQAPSVLLTSAHRVASVLPSPSTPVTPLNHHHYALTACILETLAEIPELRADALDGLSRLADAMRKRRTPFCLNDTHCWDAAVYTSIDRRIAFFSKTQQTKSPAPKRTYSDVSDMRSHHRDRLSIGSLSHFADIAVEEGRRDTDSSVSTAGANAAISAKSETSSPVDETPPLDGSAYAARLCELFRQEGYLGALLAITANTPILSST